MIESAFRPLIDRLTMLSTKSWYVKGYDHQMVIRNLESQIVIYPAEMLLAQIDYSLSKVIDLLEEKVLLEDFVPVETLWQVDEFTGKAHVIDTLPLSRWGIMHTTVEYKKELTDYQIFLRGLKACLLEDINRDKHNNHQPAVRLRKRNYEKKKHHYLGEKTNVAHIMELYRSLKKNELININTKPSDFRLVFFDERMPSRKIDWTGGVSALSCFIKRLYKRNFIKKQGGIWAITKNFFLTDGEEIDAELKSQSPSPSLILKIDRILNCLNYNK